jgi:heme A synthase
MDVGAQPVSRLRALSLSDAGIRRLVLVNAAALVLIVATGATVRLTGSGLGCEHWPGCTPHHFETKCGHSYV